MADEIDRANDKAQAWLEGQIAEHQYQLEHAVSAFESGLCRNCETRLDDGRNYCDEACRNDHWNRMMAVKRNGKCRG